MHDTTGFLQAPELSSNLEWMLQSGQVSSTTLIDCLVREYYVPFFELAQLVFNDPDLARECTHHALAMATERAPHYRASYGAKTWLYGLLLKSCQETGRRGWQRALKSPGNLPAHTDNVEKFRIFDRQSLETRLVMALYLVYAWDIPEIAKAFKKPAYLVEARVQVACLYMSLSRNETPQSGRFSLRQTLGQLFANRWPHPSLTETEIPLLVQAISARTKGQQQQTQYSLLSKELALGGVVIVLALALGWFSRLLDRSAFPLAAQFVTPTQVEPSPTIIVPPALSSNHQQPTPSPTTLSASVGLSDTAVLTSTQAATEDRLSQVKLPQTYAEDFTRLSSSGPGVLSVVLQYWGWQGNPDDPLQIIQPVPVDPNCLPYELINYVTEHTSFNAILRFDGDPETLAHLTQAGFPVIIQRAFTPSDSISNGNLLRLNQKVIQKDSLLRTDLAAYRPAEWTAGYEIAFGSSLGQNNLLFSRPVEKGLLWVSYNMEEWMPHWQAFNYAYILIYPAEKSLTLQTVLGAQYDETANYQAAARRASDEIYSAPDNLQRFYAWFNRGVSLSYLDDYRGATSAFDKASKLLITLPAEQQPQHMLWFNTRPYWAYFYTDRYATVISLASDVIKQGGAYPPEEAYYWRALAREAQGDIPSAIVDLGAAIKLNPNFIPGQTELARIMGD